MSTTIRPREVARSVVGGTLICGAVGAAAGGLTHENDINLGKPVWR